MPGSFSRIFTRSRGSTVIDLVRIRVSVRWANAVSFIAESGSVRDALCHFISSLRATFDEAHGHEVPGPTMVVVTPTSAFRIRSGQVASAFFSSSQYWVAALTFFCSGVMGLAGVVGRLESSILEVGGLLGFSDGLSMESATKRSEEHT